MNFLVFIFYSVLAAVVSLRPLAGVPIDSWDKLLHFVFYAAFSILGFRIVKSMRRYAYVCVGIVIYGGLIEIAQSFFPGRMMSAYDFLANTLGVAAGALLAITVSRVFSKKAVSES